MALERKLTYSNPVWGSYMADPFVMKHSGEYWAYGTSVQQSDGRWFPILHSTDLTQWEYIGGALEPLTHPRCSAYWAPEVVYQAGLFYMYYSAASDAGDESHRLRVAIADQPTGPFRDMGQTLLSDQGFSIDAHPFRDPKDGQWYLFFAKDFFDERVGTGIAVVPLASDMLAPLDPARPVLRASADWQIYERNRTVYDRTWEAWHTVEGPFVLFHNNLYYCLYSGGSWQTVNYGVGFGVAERMYAQLLWFRKGYVEYRFPNRLPPNVTLDDIEVSFEVCSEAPLHHPDWPSDITVWIGDCEIGTWTSPADFGGERGALTPSWWDTQNSQFGLLKVWKVSNNGSFVDGIRISKVTLSDLAFKSGDPIRVRIGIKDNTANIGGLNLFGRKFGNYPQDIVLRQRFKRGSRE